MYSVGETVASGVTKTISDLEHVHSVDSEMDRAGSQIAVNHLAFHPGTHAGMYN